MNEVSRLFFVGDTVPNKPFELGRSLKEFCLEHDVRVFNLEGAFSSLRKPLFKAGPHLLLEPSFFSVVTECFNIATLANNHAMDFGDEGLDTTIKLCKEAGISIVGAGLNLGAAFSPLDIGNCRIISVAEHEFGAAGKDKAGIATVDRQNEVFEIIKQGRESGKFVAVVAHGGTELIPIPPPYLRQRYKLWIDYGANLIVGNHPHVVQGFELYKGKPIFYSLGNFFFSNDSFRDYPGAQWSIAVSINLANNNIRAIPVHCDSDNVVDIATDNQYEREFTRLCNLLESDNYFDIYNSIASELYKSWYPRLSTTSREDAALLLHYLRCDARRSLIQNALSQKIGEENNSGDILAICDRQDKAVSAASFSTNACNSADSLLLTIKTMDGVSLEWPQLSPGNSASHEVPTEISDIVQNAHKWSNPKLVYLTSADQWLGFEAFFEKNYMMQCDVFYCVIGGLGGFNLLTLLNPLKKLVFYDANIYAALILDLQLQLIRHCTSINEYISLIYQRPFDSLKYNFYNQDDFFQLPVESKYEEKLLEILSPRAYETYKYFYLPYIFRLPLPLYDGPTIHCTHLLPFFESKKLTDPLVSGPLSNTSVNVNTFYGGKGWLSSDETFQTVRSHLLNSKIEVLIGDVARIRPTGKFSGIYTTNIYSTKPGFGGYKRFINSFRWMIGYNDYTDWEVQYFTDNAAEGMVKYEKLVGKGNGNPHATCCQAIDSLLDLHTNQFMEVIEPHPKEGMNYGFRFYRGQKRISVKDYLKTDISGEEIIVLHILLGGGVSQKQWYDVCRKAVKESNRYVLIFEHRKECTDWPQLDVHSDNLLPHKKLDQFIYSLDYRWKKYGMSNVKGSIDDIRNIMYFLEKDGQYDIYEPRLKVNHTNPEEGAIAAQEFFRKGIKLLQSGSSEKALNYFDEVCSLCPGMPDVHFAIATAYAQLGDIYAAEKECQIELSLHPENAAAERLLRRIEKTIDECEAGRQACKGLHYV